jgi:hypothetical protein
MPAEITLISIRRGDEEIGGRAIKKVPTLRGRRSSTCSSSPARDARRSIAGSGWRRHAQHCDLDVQRRRQSLIDTAEPRRCRPT